MKKIQNPLIAPLFYLILAIAAMAAINAWTFWPEPYKYVLPLAFAIVAVIDFFVRLGNQTPTTKPATPTKPAPAPAVQKPDTKKDKTKPSELQEGLKLLTTYIVLLALAVMGFIKLAEFFRQNVREAIASSGQTTVVHAFPIDHTYNQKVERNFFLCLDPGKVYNVCDLKNGQHWQWYFDRDIEYRIKATGHEPFISMRRNQDSGGEPTAGQAGILQVRTNHRNNFLDVYRLQAYYID